VDYIDATPPVAGPYLALGCGRHTITGIGLAVCCHRSFVEIIFGDVITCAFDPMINNTSTIVHSFNRNID